MHQGYLIDINVIIDVVCDRDGADVAIKCFDKLSDEPSLKAWIAPHTPAIVNFVGRREIGENQIRDFLEGLEERVYIAPFSNLHFKQAFTYNMKDFEDAMVASCAVGVKAKGVITNNIKDFKNSPIPALTPKEFLSLD